MTAFIRRLRSLYFRGLELPVYVAACAALCAGLYLPLAITPDGDIHSIANVAGGVIKDYRTYTDGYFFLVFSAFVPMIYAALLGMALFDEAGRDLYFASFRLFPLLCFMLGITVMHLITMRALERDEYLNGITFTGAVWWFVLSEALMILLTVSYYLNWKREFDDFAFEAAPEDDAQGG